MAVVQITGFTSQLIGLSTDTKPTTNIPTGSNFYETDTKNVYIWNGSTWIAM